MKENNNYEEKQMYVEMGKRLSELRKSKKLTQQKVAEYMDISQSNVSQLENDARKLSIYSMKKLLELYGADYESVLGELKGKKNESTCNSYSTFSGIDLLKTICENTDSEDLNMAVNAYINMCVYVILRELYEANPRNTDSVFSVEKKDALKKAQNFISETPYQLLAFINASKGKVKKKSIEPPLEKAADFRAFVRNCEDFILTYLSKNNQ